MKTAGDLHAAIERAGVPIVGCDSEGNIRFGPGATSAQIQKAKQISQNFDWNAEGDAPEPPLTNVELKRIRAEWAKTDAVR